MLEVVDASKSALEVMITGFAHHWPTDAVPRRYVLDLLETLSYNNDLFPTKNREYIFRRVWKTVLTPAHRESTPMTITGLPRHRFGMKKGASLFNAGHPAWTETNVAVRNYDATKMLAAVMEYMSDRGFEV